MDELKQIITCSNPACSKQLRIPLSKNIYFTCPCCGREHHYRKNKAVKNGFIFLASLIVSLIFSFMTNFSILPVLLILAILARIYFKFLNGIIWQVVSGILRSTIIGLALMLFFQIIIYCLAFNNDLSGWLLQIDTSLITFYENLKKIAELNFFVYFLILVGMVAISILKPEWKMVKSFIRLHSGIGKIVNVMLIFTSFTFFAPTIIEKEVNEQYFKYYKVIYRDSLHQERRQLIAGEFKHLLNNQSVFGAPFYQRMSDLKDELHSWNITFSEEPERDVNNILADITDMQPGMRKADNASDETIKKAWKKISSGKGWIKSRAQYLKNAGEKTHRASIIADELTEAVQALFSELIGFLEEQFLGQPKNVAELYIKTVINGIVEKVFDTTRIPEVVRKFFEAESSANPKGLFRFLVIKSKKTTKTVQIYGRIKCGLTQKVRSAFEEWGYNVIFCNVDSNRDAMKIVSEHMEYLYKNCLPLICIDGEFVYTGSYFSFSGVECDRSQFFN